MSLVTAAAAADVYALLADGTTVQMRPATPDDFCAVKAMHEAMSPDNAYLRFFNLGKVAAEVEARRICHEPAAGHVALLALAGEDVAGCASYDAVTTRGPLAADMRDEATAEIAFAVADHMHHRGVATLLLEHLVAFARGHRIQTFVAVTLNENPAMLRVFSDAGLPVRRHSADGLVEVTVTLPRDGTGIALDSYLAAVEKRERTAGAASLRHVFAPESVVVIGASRRQGTAGRPIPDNIRTGYAGRLYAVNPHARQIGGIPCLPAVADLPKAPDLALIAVPAGAVSGAAEECGELGVKALTVITSGLDTAASGSRHPRRPAGGVQCYR